MGLPEEERGDDVVFCAGYLSRQHLALGNLQEANHFEQKAVEEAERIGEKSLLRAVLFGLGDTWHQLGELDKAEQACLAAEKIPTVENAQLLAGRAHRRLLV